MSILDKAIAAVTPPETQEARDQARAKARAAAEPRDWLSQILEHHLRLEEAFAAVSAAGEAASRATAQKRLGVILTGHAIAEESVIYPALAQAGEKGHAEMGYSEQVMVKMQMAALEAMDPMSQDFADKLEHIRGAVAHHMFEEEGNWFLELKEKAPAETQSKITQRYREEFDRYVGKAGAMDGRDPSLQSRPWEESGTIVQEPKSDSSGSTPPSGRP